jgi:translation elongation factor EF-Tu-like GTPase
MDDDKRILNVNVGILGHIDSGKTSLGAFAHPPGAET